jgi:hypothetical protein
METVGQSGVWMGNCQLSNQCARFYISLGGHDITFKVGASTRGYCSDYQADYQGEVIPVQIEVRSKDNETRSRSPAKPWETEFVAHLTELVWSDWPTNGAAFLAVTRAVIRVYSKSTMLSILARSSQRRLPPPTLLLRSFSSSAPTWQAVPTETKPLNKEFKIYRWVLSSLLLLSNCLHSPFTVILL